MTRIYKLVNELKIKVRNFVPYQHTKFCSVQYEASATSLRPPPLFLIASDEEKIATKKSPPCEVLLICGTIPRFSDCRRLWPSAKNATKKKSSRRLAIRG
ncbi:hypothetical protein GW17_00021739 [Ensete ventricosum]|nr:hypothetical protein GW17_00021739 [Ensete ventricosum]